jgi:nucleolar protein 4
MEDRKSKTLFIRNLPFTTNNDGLEKVFSEIGPLKQCFVVKKKGSYLPPLVYFDILSL